MTEDAEKVPHLRECLIALARSVANVGAVINGIDRTDVPMLLKAFGQLIEYRKEFEAISKALEAQHDLLSTGLIPPAFENAEITGLKIGGRSFYISRRINASIPAHKREKGNKWVREIAKCPELIVEHINPKQLSSLVASYFEEHAELPPDDAISTHIQTFTSSRKV